LPNWFALNLDVMVTAGTPATLAVKKAAISVALVMAAIGDAVGVGVVLSLARTRRQHYGAQRDGDRPRRQAAAAARGSRLACRTFR
jgi:hypothetical protein